MLSFPSTNNNRRDLDETPLARRGSMVDPMQDILDSASRHPPPASSLDTSFVSGGFRAPQLIAINALLDVVILCEGNVLRAANILDINERNDRNKDRDKTYSSLLSEITFAADGFDAHAEDEVVLSDHIPPTTPIQGVEFSPSGSSLLVWGEGYVGVARPPQKRRVAGRGDPHFSSSAATPSPARPTPRSDRHGTPSEINGLADKWRWTLVDLSGHAIDVMKQKIVKASWHPLSEHCVTLLTTSRDGVGPASIMFQVPGQARPETLSIPEGQTNSPPVDLAYGTGKGWQLFAVYILRKDGSLAAVCPLVPKNARVAKDELADLWSEISDRLAAVRWELSRESLDAQFVSHSMAAEREALDTEMVSLEQQHQWLRENFTDDLNYEDLDEGGSPVRGSGAVDLGSRRVQAPREPVLQEEIVPGRNTPRKIGSRGNVRGASGMGVAAGSTTGGGLSAQDAGSACGILVLDGAARLPGAEKIPAADEGDMPTLIAVAYRGGYVDLVLVPSGVEPRWAARPGVATMPSKDSQGKIFRQGTVFESLDLAERESDDSTRRKQGLTLTLGFGPWSLLVATPYRVTSIVVQWASEVSLAASSARERVATAEVGSRLDSDLRAVLRKRSESPVTEVLFVPPGSPAGRIVSLAPVANFHLGFVAIARLSGGGLEVANVSVVTRQAKEMASAVKLARDQNTPRNGYMLPPYEETLERTQDVLENLRLGKSLNSADKLPSGTRLSQLYTDNRGTKAFQKEWERLVKDGFTPLRELCGKTSIRAAMLRDVYEGQSETAQKLSTRINKLKISQQDVEERLVGIHEVAEEHRARAASVLAMVQAAKLEVPHSELKFREELKETQWYIARRKAMFDPAQRQVEELVAAEKEVEESLIRDGQGAGSDVAGGLTEQETKDVWKMLQADKERILTLSRRLAAARERLQELGVKRE